MKLQIQTPEKALKPFLRQKPLRSQIDTFKAHLIALLDKISIIEQQPKDETEEHLKNNIRDFLRDTYYKDTNAINTKDKKDLVIHVGKETNSNIGVIIEAKRPTNTSEMVSDKNANKKALHELILYYLNERITKANNELKQLVITNINEWYIIDANVFDKIIYKPNFIKLYTNKVNDKKDNPWFYEEVAKLIDKSDAVLDCVYFNIKNYEKALRNVDKTDDKKLINLYKILSPLHLLKVAATNDSNKLDKPFYFELLHIIGLEEVKEGSKNIIRRKVADVNKASFIEMAIKKLKTKGIHKVKEVSNYGDTTDDKYYNIALELCITWINRILFLKLLEGQLLNYHKDNKDYCFLNTATIHDFDELFTLFHQVLAVNIKDREPDIQSKYKLVPYLNSSLFEISDLEDETIQIDSLDNNEILAFSSSTVLKEHKKKAKGLPTLEYLFQFLNAHDFASEGEEDIQEENKTIINASVLGTVFEKINGYKDGSIYTPAFITMYMCKESIRKAVVDKFNEVKGWQAKNFIDLSNEINDRTEANTIINDLKICDPAVGSGHFLVSALNELITIKSELNILIDEQGKTLRDYEIEIINDELIITDENGNPFAYNPLSKESNRVQKTLFTEKQAIIENCLFGVDINPNSVKICRLRLWIELLKNAYYKAETNYTELETLPNIDINIKCGNSLISRFMLNDDLSKALKSIKYDIKAYRGFVSDYKNEKNRDTKRELQHLIDTIKNDFKTELSFRNKEAKDYVKTRTQVVKLSSEINRLKEWNEKVPNKLKEDLKKANNRLAKVQKSIDEIKNNIIYKHAFEWRFEFPEILNDDGSFKGFDVIIGNPPYIKEDTNRNAFNGLRNLDCYQGKMDIWYLFGDLGLKILKPNHNLCYIATNNWVTNAGASNFRNIVIQNSQIISLIDFGAYMVFENASIQTMIMHFKKRKMSDDYTFDFRRLDGKKPILENALNLLSGTPSDQCIYLAPKINKVSSLNKTLTFNSNTNLDLLDKIKLKHNFTLREKPNRKLKLNAEIGSGIDVLQDFVSKANVQKLNGKAKVGDGIFVLSIDEFEKKNFSKSEKEIIKPFYTTEQLQKFYGNSENKFWILYTKSDIDKIDEKTKKIPINDYPKIKEHLDVFKDIMTSDHKPYGLHRTREPHLFQGEKIFALRKCPNEPKFTYTNFDCYVSRAFLIVQSERINLKYLTGLLNSKLIAFWLRKKGKMQGNAYQIDKEPLLQIPIYKPSETVETAIAEIVDKIIIAKQNNEPTADLENQIDAWVYKLYDLTEDEIEMVAFTK